MSSVQQRRSPSRSLPAPPHTLIRTHRYFKKHEKDKKVLGMLQPGEVVTCLETKQDKSKKVKIRHERGCAHLPQLLRRAAAELAAVAAAAVPAAAAASSGSGSGDRRRSSPAARFARHTFHATGGHRSRRPTAGWCSSPSVTGDHCQQFRVELCFDRSQRSVCHTRCDSVPHSPGGTPQMPVDAAAFAPPQQTEPSRGPPVAAAEDFATDDPDPAPAPISRGVEDPVTGEVRFTLLKGPQGFGINIDDRGVVIGFTGTDSPAVQKPARRLLPAVLLQERV